MIQQKMFNTVCIIMILWQVSLGILEKDENKIDDITDILEHLHNCVADVDGQPVQSVAFGDDLMCERIQQAQQSRINCNSAFECLLKVLHCRIADWHKRVILLHRYAWSKESAESKESA